MEYIPDRSEGNPIRRHARLPQRAAQRPILQTLAHPLEHQQRLVLQGYPNVFSIEYSSVLKSQYHPRHEEQVNSSKYVLYRSPKKLFGIKLWLTRNYPPPLGPSYDPRNNPTAGSWEEGVSFERGTLVWQTVRSFKLITYKRVWGPVSRAIL